MNPATRTEWMTIAAARLLSDHHVCFVGIGLPSAACNLARLTHAPNIVLVYESGAIGTRSNVLPLSIGDGELATTATCVIPLPEVFSFFLQAGRIDTGFLGAAQIDRFGNLNSTVIGPYEAPSVRLPGSGGAPEIAIHAKQICVILKASPRSFVEKLDFCSSAGYLQGHHMRKRIGMSGGGPRAVVTDFGMLAPNEETEELELTALFEGATPEEARRAVGWPLKVVDNVRAIEPPSACELDTLRELNARTREAHARSIRVSIGPKESP